MATILGMLIFIGVLFTCVIPLFLYVNQVNSFYDQAVVEMRNIDYDRTAERIDVFVYPLNQSSNDIMVFAKNKSPLSVKILRVWVNDDYFNISLQVPGVGWNVSEPMNIEDMLPSSGTKSFRGMVTTSRGNTFASLTGSLYYTAGVGWSSGGTLSIYVVIFSYTSGTANFDVTVTDESPPPTVIYDETVVLLGFTESYILKVDVPQPGTYRVKVTEQGEGICADENVLINWEAPSAWVYAYGT
jgi:hypothetical protein